MKKIITIILLIILSIVLIVEGYLFLGKAPEAKNIKWGVTFSQKHTQNFGLDWKQTYTDILDDLKVRNLRIIVYWDFIEPAKDIFNFDDLDWQVKEAENRNTKIALIIGMKVPRWPECHLPSWAQGLDKSQQQEEILNMLSKIVLRYKDSPALSYWQVENEPFFPFGTCPWADTNFLREEIKFVKSLDSKSHPILITESGEWSPWIAAPQYGDIMGTTLYKKVYFNQLKSYITYPFPAVYYWRKAQIVKKLFGKDVICVELQAEPWGPKLLYDISLEEQEKTMNLEQFRYNIEFAKKTGLKEFSLWGVEWWYWMKMKNNDASIWNEAKGLFEANI